jgi:hypothetical protein
MVPLFYTLEQIKMIVFLFGIVLGLIFTILAGLFMNACSQYLCGQVGS